MQLNFENFVQVVGNLSRGLWSHDEARLWVENSYQVILGETEAVLATLERVNYPDPEEVELGLGGFRDFQEALECLWHFLEQPHNEDWLHQALSLAVSARDQLLQAVGLNELSCDEMGLEILA